jgi:hypothetical protein
MRKARAAGLHFRKSGAQIPASTVHAILRNRVYTGQFDWNGKTYEGRHEALVSIDLWEQVQNVIGGRLAKKSKLGKRDFAFSGLIACHACGCAVVGEIKKERYVYYHCTGYADKCQGNPVSCRRKYVREEVLEGQFTELLGRLKFDDEVRFPVERRFDSRPRWRHPLNFLQSLVESGEEEPDYEAQHVFGRADYWDFEGAGGRPSCDLVDTGLSGRPLFASSPTASCLNSSVY